MASRFDVYALGPARDAATIERFLSKFVSLAGREPHWRPVGLRAAAPSLKDAVALGVADQALPYTLELEPHDHRLPSLARLVFTGDRKLILGLSVDDDEPGDGPHRTANELLAALRELGCVAGFVTQDEPPPPNAHALQAEVDARASSGERSGFFR